MLLLSDFTTSVDRALEEINPLYPGLPGLVVCGSHSPASVDELDDLIETIMLHRLRGKPVLGICYGYQLIAIEFARNVLGIKDAVSEEWAEGGTPVVKKRPELKVGLIDSESWWTNYYVDFEGYPKLSHMLDNENMFGTPYHPEYQSWKGHPHEVLTEFLNYAKMAS